MTELRKPVSRRTTLLLDNRIATRNRDRITITLHPDQTIGFRAYKSRREIRLPLVAVYRLAIQAEAEEKRKTKKRRMVRRTSL